MKDIISLIPPNHIINDKRYGNIADFALRTDILRRYLTLCEPDERIRSGNCSDYDIFRAFIECARKNSDRSSRTYLYFDEVMKNVLGISADELIFGALDSDELWTRVAMALLKDENSLWGIISRSPLESLGVALAPWEKSELPENIGNTEIKRIVCPLGVRGKSIFEAVSFADFDELSAYIRESVKDSDGCAIFIDELDFEFQKPNPYISAMTYNKIQKGLPIKASEMNILKTQALREVILSSAGADREVYFVISSASSIKNLYQTEQLIDYIDESARERVNVTLFAPDAVGYSFALSMKAKNYEKITADAALCGTDCYFITEAEAKYFGVGAMPEKMASLSATPAPFGRIV